MLTFPVLCGIMTSSYFLVVIMSFFEYFDTSIALYVSISIRGCVCLVDLNIKIPDGFLEEEERCGFTVTTRRKEIWAIEIDLLMQLDRVCKEHGLKYCVGAGTLLGAVRHQGFIPWDDDVDVYMLRKDYDELMELANEFSPPYVLQNINTDKSIIPLFSRLRNTQTGDAISGYTYKGSWNGLWVDIFPLDGISPDKWKDKGQKINNWVRQGFCRGHNLLKKRKHDERINRRILKVILKILAPIFFRDPRKLYKKYDDNLKKYSTESVEMVGNRTIVFDCPKSRRPKTDYEDLVSMPFEFVEVPAPRAYDSMLRQQYGDYMELPKEKQSKKHTGLTILSD